MSNFENAVSIVLAHEGGYVNNPHDPGAQTNFGITLGFLQDHPDVIHHVGSITAEDIKNLTREDAIHIYQTEWWDKYKYGAINDQTLATKVFDFAVNMGASRAHKLLQQAINTTFNMKLTVDGVLGPATMSVINSIVIDANTEHKLIDSYSVAAWAFYQSLIKNNGSLSVFAQGWKNRAYAVKYDGNVAKSTKIA